MQNELILTEFKRKLRIKKTPLKELRSYIKYAEEFLNDFAKFSAIKDIPIDVIENYIIKNVEVKQSTAVYQKRMALAVEKLYELMDDRTLNLSTLLSTNSQHKLPSFFSKDDVKKIFEATVNLKHKTLLMLIYSCGLRVGEVLNLKIKDVNFKEKSIFILGLNKSQGRTLNLVQKMIDKLQQYLEVYKPDTYIFEGSTGGKYSARSVQLTLKKAIRKAKLKSDGTVHTLRHSYAIHLIQAGIGVDELKILLGHENISTTMIYTQVSGTTKIQKWSPLDFL